MASPRGANPYYILTILIISRIKPGDECPRSDQAPAGYDEGGFAGVTTLPGFIADYGLQHASAALRANISSLGVLGAALGAILSLVAADRLGRLRTWRVFMALWMSGLLVTLLAGGVRGLLLASRVWSGLGAGGLTVVAPLYLSEIAPARTRGMVVSCYMVVLLSFLMLGFFISYAAGKTLPDTRGQYQVVLGVALIPGGVAFAASFFIRDTPRWLASQGRTDAALVSLARLRGSIPRDPVIEQEFARMVAQDREKEQILAGVSAATIVREIVSVPSYRNRFLLGVAMQTVAQWSGGNGITYYIPQIFRFAGVHSQNLSLITSGAYGAVKLVFTMIFTWGLVDVFGRRRCLLAGLFLQCITHTYMAVYAGLWIGSGNKTASDAAIASVFVYAVGWSVGLCTVQYLYGTEILPTRIRSFCYAANMTIHWFFQFAVVRAAPPMFEKLHIWGAYLFWAVAYRWSEWMSYSPDHGL
ncbi:Quinate permease [Escovopsis weberi]|uniref:Quinate permease n=1 Tax=Escovopsis weberi TaxID=150374 RepID=A0A0M9VSS3_ESCWE|nr:Quinate permease [Escovopsis weberi]